MGMATAIAGTGILASGIQAIKGAQQQRDARQALENYNRQDLENVAEGLQVSTLGADLQREEQARLASSQVEALQGAGARGLLGGLGRVEAGNQMMNREIAANLDAQQKQIDQMYAQDQANIRGMQEQREVGDISALSSQYNAGNAMLWQGIGGIAQSGMAALSGGLGKGAVDGKTPPTTTTTSPTTTTPTTTQFDVYKSLSNTIGSMGATGGTARSTAMKNALTNPDIAKNYVADFGSNFSQQSTQQPNYGPNPNMNQFLMNQFYSPNQRTQ
jgi:hypothetical protein